MSFTVTGSDLDGDPLTYSAAVLSTPDPSQPVVGWTLDATSGDFAWTPACSDLPGKYVFAFCASDSFASACDTTNIVLASANEPPSAVAGGPYAGIAGIPVEFNGLQSADPEGNIVKYFWLFGDDGKATGMIADHTYKDPGAYIVTLTVTDGGPCAKSDAASTTAEIFEHNCEAVVFRCPSGQVINLVKNDPKPTKHCIRVEPINQCFAVSDIDVATVRMKFDGKEIAPDPKSALVGDASPCENKSDDLQLCFLRDDLAFLFSSLSKVGKQQQVTVTVSGSLTTGGGFSGTVDVSVIPPP